MSDQTLSDLVLLVGAALVFLGGPILAWLIYCWAKDRRRRRVAEEQADERHAQELRVINVSIHAAPGASLAPTFFGWDPYLGQLVMPVDLEPAAIFEALVTLRRISQPTAIGPGWITPPPLPLPLGEYLEGECLEVLAEAVSPE